MNEWEELEVCYLWVEGRKVANEWAEDHKDE